MASSVIADARVWRHGECIGKHVSDDDIAQAVLDEDDIVWVDLLDPTEADLAALAEKLNIGETAVEDALAPYERAKVTRHDHHLFFTVYGVHRDEQKPSARGNLVTSRISGFILPQGLVTIRLTRPGHPTFDMSDVVRRWDDNAELIASGTSALVHGLLDSVVDGHFSTIQQLDDAMEDLEDILFAEEQTGEEFLSQVYGIRKDLVALRRVVLPMREIVNALMRSRGRRGDNLDAWYDDLYDHVLRASEWTESLRDMVTSVFETNLSLQDARLNTIMKKLAAWASIIAVPTAITGYFGQNVPYPGFSQMWGFWLSVALMVGLSVGLYFAFRARDWL